MTSKEALERISSIDLQEYPSEEEMYAFKECRVSPIPLGLCFTEEFETISKDLEVLDILKRYFKYRKGEITKEETNISEKDVGRIKEWIEN